MTATTALIAFAEALAAPESAWSLVDAGFSVHVLARRGRRAALRHSKHVVIHEVTAPEDDYAATHAEIDGLLRTWPVTEAEKCVILPLDDAAVWMFSRHAKMPGWVFAGPRGSSADFALDKRLQIEAALAAGMNVPHTSVASTPSEVLTRAKELPLVLRSARAVGSSANRLHRGRSWICGTERELAAALREWAGSEPLLVQPYIRGTGEGVFGLATADGIRAWSAHRRLRMMNPHGSGASACQSQSVPEQIRGQVECLVRQVKWRGVFMVEYLRDCAGLLWFVEFNGRAWGSMALARRQNLEYPAWAAKLALAQDFVTSDPQAIGIRCRSVAREMLHLLFVARGRKSAALADWPSFWKTAYAMVRERDHLYNWRPSDRMVFWADLYYSLLDVCER
jgi:predicted ATP-grasp superfamily ATP-dependent carboligase